MAFIGVLDKLVDMLKKADQSNDRDAVDLIFRMLNTQMVEVTESWRITNPMLRSIKCGYLSYWKFTFLIQMGWRMLEIKLMIWVK